MPSEQGSRGVAALIGQSVIAPYIPPQARPSIREQTLLIAKDYVTKDRNREAGDPEKNFDTIARMWNAYNSARGLHGAMIPHDIAIFMILLKVARIATSPTKHDHWIDIAGYAACGAECVAEVK